jgi:hypothetical protein
VVKEKMSEFPDGEKYEKKSADMKRLTEIDEKNNRLEKLSKEDLEFIYEIDSEIKGFGYQKDPRIEEIIRKRDIKSDLSLVMGFSQEEISLTKKEALCGGVKYHYGKLNFDDLKSAENLKLPQIVSGSISFNKLESAEGLNLPETIGGSLDLGNLKSVKGLKLPKMIGGGLSFFSLRSAENLNLPETIGGSLDLGVLKSSEGLKLPATIGGSLDLGALRSAENLNLPETIGKSLDLGNLKSVKGLKLPKMIGGHINFKSLQSDELQELRSKYPQFKFGE